MTHRRVLVLVCAGDLRVADPKSRGMYVPLRKLLPPLGDTLAPGDHGREYIYRLQA